MNGAEVYVPGSVVHAITHRIVNAAVEKEVTRLAFTIIAIVFCATGLIHAVEDFGRDVFLSICFSFFFFGCCSFWMFLLLSCGLACG